MTSMTSMTGMTDQTKPLGSVRARPKKGRGPRVQITLNNAGERNLRTIRKYFNEQVGTEVSDTLIVRRSFELFAERLTEGWADKDAALEEMTGITRQMRQ